MKTRFYVIYHAPSISVDQGQKKVAKYTDRMIASSVSRFNNILSSLRPFSVFVEKEWVNGKDVETPEED
jgi:hypothetical protein